VGTAQSAFKKLVTTLNKKILATILIAFYTAAFAHQKKENINLTSNQNSTYQYKSEKNINTKIFIQGLYDNALGGAIDFKVKENLSIGPILKIFSTGNDDQAYAAGLEGNYSLTGDVMSTGWIINPYVEYFHEYIHISYFNLNFENSKIIVGTNILHQWVWDEGINIQLGIGILYPDPAFTFLFNSALGLNFNFSIGYIF
jgi:hypothetical protein